LEVGEGDKYLTNEKMSHTKEWTYSLDSDIDDFILSLIKYPSFLIPTIVVATSFSPTKIPSHNFPILLSCMSKRGMWLKGNYDYRKSLQVG
jgi:hypothetical protein